ncbi:hypothetical protein MFRU_002g04160 [Monilinia fructicola]|uniref:Ubiquitin-like modifier HUB1 n=2 Tax=Monilinia fructicola TaxID=38448 RepID=A0A5M9K1X6_MONFR|nr:hypothetical protein EYC84_004157 [Monilinia fructicola]KAG4035069.1 hypothetical protein MFRU_002g04160 [Monilinia fructicola]
MAGLKLKKRARSRSPERDTDKTYRKRSRSPRRDRKRSPIRERERERDREGERGRERRVSPPTNAANDDLDIAGKFGSASSATPQRRDDEGSKDAGAPEEEDGLDIASKFGAAAFSKFKAASASASTSKDRTADSSNPPARPPAAPISTPVSASSAPSNEPMIIVHVNDRLGTKAAIPCLASDPIKLFKAQVAARIGRQPHEIMLKRQGERPFKDRLTLEDYGVGNGVQLDLEIDTGE